MPICCPISLPQLSQEEFAELDYLVMRSAFETHRELGRLADETIYQADFAARLQSAGLATQRELPVTVSFRSFVKTYYLDLVVASKVIYELKAVRKLTEEHAAQLLNYLLMLNVCHGKLLNFRNASIDPVFVNAPLTLEQRRSFLINDKRWQGDQTTRDWIIEMLRDWGTALELPLYHQGIIHLLGGNEAVTHLLPMQRDSTPLGNQRFHLMEPDAAFRITAFTKATRAYENQIKQLMQHSLLRHIHWINISHHEVTFTTVRR